MLSILCLLFLKHWYVDFVSQTNEHIDGKFIYGNLKGIEHAFWHGLLTALIFGLVVPPYLSLMLGLADMLLHYHIDYAKIQFERKELSEKKGWSVFGFDQLAHQLTYVILTALAMGFEWHNI